METEIIHAPAPSGAVILDSSTCFTAPALVNIMKQCAVSWKPVLAYVPMLNSHAERMVGPIQR